MSFFSGAQLVAGGKPIAPQRLAVAELDRQHRIP
jgi:hypothetical protein